jgi:hypothetical protein
MRRAARRLLAPLTLLAAIAAGACTAPEPVATPVPVPAQAVACSIAAIGDDMTPVAAADVGVYFETGGDPGLEIARADLEGYLGTLWGGSFPVGTAAPDFSKRATVWLSTSAAAVAKAGLAAGMTYAIQRVDGASGTVVVVAAHDAEGLEEGAYALLEHLGVRFFHPKEEMVPALGGPRLPAGISVARAPAMASRGLQLHTLHPIEYLAMFNEPSAANLADAKRLVDWLVKTGQNYLQWALLGTVSWSGFAPYAQSIIDYAHMRGVKVGAVVQVWGGAALQNNYVLINDETSWQAEMDQGLDQLMTVGWDQVELALGEFVSAGPDAVIAWMNEAVAHLASTSPGVKVSVQNHVGNYPELWVDYQGQTVFYYHLPQFADPRLGQTVHTLFFFDVYRDWATYAHPNFHLQHDYILQELPKRTVKYFPETAYWISADIDVPLFLPEYLFARWNDIHGLVDQAAAMGLPPLAGHVMFNSGHEWNYWLTDYLTAKMLWQPDEPLSTFLRDYTSAFGSCAPEVLGAMESLVDLQARYLFDDRLVAYVQGENATVDEGYLVGLETHPKRVEFEQVLAMNAADQRVFEVSVVANLEAMAAEMRPIEDAIAARCAGADEAIAPWCDELWDGISITRNRAEHAALLYRAVLARAEGTDPEGYYTSATAKTTEAHAIVTRREPHYRYDLDRLTGVYQNPTVYGFGYLRPAHTQCYWLRREQQVRTLLDTGFPASVASLPTCMD